MIEDFIEKVEMVNRLYEIVEKNQSISAPLLQEELADEKASVLSFLVDDCYLRCKYWLEKKSNPKCALIIKLIYDNIQKRQNGYCSSAQKSILSRIEAINIKLTEEYRYNVITLKFLSPIY